MGSVSDEDHISTTSWRASRFFIVTTILIGFFCHVFLFGFIVPILPYMLQVRLGVHKENAQIYTSALLAIHAASSFISSPIIGYVADKIPQRRTPLLVALASELIATTMVAFSPNLPLLFIGRACQAISGTLLWIVGLATLSDTIGVENMGSIMGMSSAVVSSAISFGPMLGGWLNELVGYYATWSVALAIIVVDLVMRLLMIERPRRDRAPAKPAPCGTYDRSSDDTCDERTILVPDINSSNQAVEEKTGVYFYFYLFRNSRYIASQFAYMVYAVLLSSFDATLPLHVHKRFGWGSGLAGMMFLALQAPQMLLSPVFGWLRDQYGTRVLTTLALGLSAPALFSLGVPKEAGTHTGKAVYVVSIICIGSLFSMLNGVGQIEGKYVVDELESRNPGVFGPNGGYSRSHAVATMSFMFGVFVGPFVAGLLVTHYGYQTMCISCALLCLCAAVSSFIFLKDTKLRL